MRTFGTMGTDLNFFGTGVLKIGTFHGYSFGGGGDNGDIDDLLRFLSYLSFGG